MKELKDYLNEVDNLKGLLNFATEEEVRQILNEVRCLISEAYVAGINFQENQRKGASK